MKSILIDKEGMLIAFKLLGRDGLSMNHYDLAVTASGDYSAEEWKTFLSEPDIAEYIKKEMEIIRVAEVNKIVSGAATSRSVGQAQVLSALAKFEDHSSQKEGPAFIYCYVPLNEEQRHAPNVLLVDEDGKPI